MKMSPGIDYTPVKRRVSLIVEIEVGNMNPHENTEKIATGDAIALANDMLRPAAVSVLHVGDEEDDE